VKGKVWTYCTQVCASMQYPLLKVAIKGFIKQ